jgi:hypothetical protein
MRRSRLKRFILLILGTRERWPLLSRVLASTLVFFFAFSVRSLHAVDLAPLMEGRSQPGVRMATRYEAAADAILRGDGVLSPGHSDPHETGLLARPPGYPLFLAGVYEVLGRGFFGVGVFQNLVDSASAVLLFWVAGRLLGDRVGLVAAGLYGLGHFSAYYANLVTPDTLCVFPILAAFLVLFHGGSKHALLRHAVAGALMGACAWLRPNALVLGAFWALALLALRGLGRTQLVRAGVLALASLLVIAPITLRNYRTYGKFVPISINMGIVLWEGIADAGGESYGAKGKDYEVAWQEAQESQNARYAEWWASPDGIERDRARIRKSVAVIQAHPIFFAKATLLRLARMLTYAYDEPPLLSASAPLDSAPPHPGLASLCVSWGEALSQVRGSVRLAQVILRALLVPSYVLGFLAVLLLSPGRTLSIGVVPLSVLLFQSPLHLEFRVTLPMHAFLLVFAASGLVCLAGLGRLVAARDQGRKVVEKDQDDKG